MYGVYGGLPTGIAESSVVAATSYQHAMAHMKPAWTDVELHIVMHPCEARRNRCVVWYNSDY
jgi:hypothetical protein